VLVLSVKRIRHITIVKDYTVRLSFDDGTEGTIDFSGEPMTGVFEAWKDLAFFHKVQIGNRGRTLEWPSDIDLCADSLWIQATGADPAGFYRALPTAVGHA
jgi:hypothetical protein